MCDNIRELRKMCSRVGITNIILEREIKLVINDLSFQIEAQNELIKRGRAEIKKLEHSFQDEQTTCDLIENTSGDD